MIVIQSEGVRRIGSPHLWHVLVAEDNSMVYVHTGANPMTWTSLPDVEEPFRKVFRSLLDCEDVLTKAVDGKDYMLTDDERAKLGERFPDTPRNAKLDPWNKNILARWQKESNRIATEIRPDTPTVGDRVLYADGKVGVVARVGKYDVQPSSGPGERACNIDGGVASFSGGLRSSVAIEKFIPAGDDVVWMWMFSHEYVGAHNGVNVDVKVRAWTLDLNSDYGPRDFEDDHFPRYPRTISD